MNCTVQNEIAIERSARVAQLEGIFDVPPSAKAKITWEVSLPIEDHSWSIGLIVGPSGSGKSSIARQMFGDHLAGTYEWPANKSILDAFPVKMAIRDITALLSSVGFSSPPSWVRPFRALSNGEQFRVSLARSIAEAESMVVIDEFTSVVDRQVAQIGSAAVAKTIRRSGRQFIAVTCHDDVEAWLNPDWIYQPHLLRFQWRALQPRPAIRLAVSRVHHSAWQIFAKHHYLTAELCKAAICFCAFIDGNPIAFHSYLPFFGKLKDNRGARRGHRSVCLPDFQGVGIGNALITYLASMWAGLDTRVFRNTGHPSEIASASRSKDWQMIRAPSLSTPDGGGGGGRSSQGYVVARALDRFTASFEYCGPAMPTIDARRLLENSWASR